MKKNSYVGIGVGVAGLSEGSSRVVGHGIPTQQLTADCPLLYRRRT